MVCFKGMSRQDNIEPGRPKDLPVEEKPGR